MKTGRPRAETLNPAAVDYRLTALGKSKTWLCGEVCITPGQLGDAMSDSRRKGIAPEKVEEIARVLGCPPEVIAPARLPRFVALRAGDEVPAGAA